MFSKWKQIQYDTCVTHVLYCSTKTLLLMSSLWNLVGVIARYLSHSYSLYVFSFNIQSIPMNICHLWPLLFTPHYTFPIWACIYLYALSIFCVLLNTKFVRVFFSKVHWSFSESSKTVFKHIFAFFPTCFVL